MPDAIPKYQIENPKLIKSLPIHLGWLFCLLRTMRERQKIALEIVWLEEGTIHLLVPFLHQELENLWWVVDTGASKSVIDKTLSLRLIEEESEGSMATGLGQEMVETSVGTIREFRLGEDCFEPLQVAIVDLSHINEEYAKYSDKKIAGLLGSDFFYREKAVIDYEQRIISL